MCAGCHGIHGEGQGFFPGLPGPETGTVEAFWRVVREGRPGKGMPAFGPELVSDGELDAMFARLTAR